MRLPWRKEVSGGRTLAKAIHSMTEGDGPDARADEMARGDELLEKHHVETIELGSLAKLPPFRPVVISLMRLFDRENVTTDEIAHLVESDPSMAAELLAVVNSPLFALKATVTHPAQAVSLLGFETTRSLAATLGMRSMMQGGPRTPVVRRFWVHSLAAATIAQNFARSFKVDPHAIYVAVLLHDLGRLGLLAAHPEEYSAVALASHENTAEILAAEETRLGMTHCRAGEMLASAWRLPEPVGKVNRQHHAAPSGEPEVVLAQLACQLADDFQFQAIPRRDVQKPEETIAALAPEGLHEILIARLEGVNTEILTAIQTLDF